MKSKCLIALLALTLIGGYEVLPANAQAPSADQVIKVDPELCALMLRKGRESFSRARYNEAKEYFRRAVQADPNSQKAWAFYDMTQLYTVAEQFKNHGRIVASSAPAPEETAAPAPAPTPAPPEQAKEKAAPVKKEKPAPPAVKEKAPAPAEIKKPAEPAKPAVTAPAPPAPPATPAPAPAPKPTPAPGGMKILKDEGC